MSKLIGWVLVVAMTSGAVANASGGKKHANKLERWDTVERLKPGTEIDVLAGDQAGAEACLVSAVDDGALTCLREDAASDTRLVFPRSEVREVRVWEVAPDRHVGRWILAGVLLGVGVALMVEGNIVGIAVYGLVLLGAEGAQQMGPPMPPRPPAPQRMRWRLVYRSMTP
jgi:hypothetical protein